MLRSWFRSSRPESLYLSADSKDESQAINAVTTEFSDLKETEALVFMGHGTTHQVNTVYAGLDQKFKESAHANVFIGTVEADPTIHNLVKEVTSFQMRFCQNIFYKKELLLS